MDKFNIILATSKNSVLGKNNSIPWKYSKDMEYFKKLTTFSPTKLLNVIIMGRKTWESLPKILPNRISIVISNTLKSDKCYVVKSFDEALKKAHSLMINKIWVIGGKQLYQEALSHYLCGDIYHTLINEEYEGDVFLELKHYYVKSSYIEDKLDFRKLELNGEYNYLKLLSKIISTGEYRNTRNSYTWSLFDESLFFDLKEGFPILTTKKMFWKGIVEELLFFIKGDTNSKNLENKGVNIWKGNTTQEFIDNLKLPYKEGDMGPLYGFNWRHFGANYESCDKNYNGLGYDQFKKIINEIKENPTSRRILMTDFNPAQAHLGVLYPCHSLILQFYVRGKKLDVKMYQRSVDSFLGLPFNISSTALLLCIISKLTNKIPGRVSLTLGDCHIYESHKEQVKRQLKRVPYIFPKLNIPDFDSLEQVENSNLEDYVLNDYKHHPGIKASMVV